MRPRARLRRDPVIDPARSSPAERAHLVDELYAVHCEIFDGVDRDAFVRTVIDSDGAMTRIQLFREPSGAVAGYVAIHGYLRELEGRQTLVVRSEVGVRREWRGSTPHAPFVIGQTLRLCVRYPLHRKMVFACPVHPSSFYGLTRRAVRSWPRPSEPTPSRIRATMLELADSFGMRVVPGRDPEIRRVGWVTRDADVDRDFWARHPADEVRLFRSRNPGYSRGEGLLMLVPMSLSLVLMATGRYLFGRARRALRGSSRPSLGLPSS